MDKLVVTSAPHIHSGASNRRVMLDVVLALLPAAIASVILFGIPALLVILACVLGAVASEAVFNWIVKKPQTIGDFSAVVTGLLLALNLRADVPLWQCVVGSAFAMIVVKGLFGGLGKNFANPAIAARVFMLMAFASVAGGSMPVVVELTTSATPLEILKNGVEGMPAIKDMLLGLRGGAIGEGCIVALLLGYAYLVARKHIKWFVPAIFVGSVFLCYFIATGDAMLALYQILSGGLFIGAIYMATDYVTTPITSRGRSLFALGCGLITFAVRYFGKYPEGVSFSILVMNILTPFIDKISAHENLGGSGRHRRKLGRWKAPVALVSIAVVAALALCGVNAITAPVIQKNAAGQQTGLLYGLMPEAQGFEILHSTVSGESTLVDVPETVQGVYKETSGQGYALLLSTTKGYTGNAIEITMAVDAEGKIIGTELRAYPESKDFGAEFPLSFAGQDSTLSGVNLVAGCTYSSVAYKDAVADGFAALINNGLIVEAVKSDEQILTELLPSVYPGVANPYGVVQAEVVEATGTYIASAMKAMNEKGMVYFAKDGEASFLAIVNAVGGCKVYDTAGADVTVDHTDLVAEVTAHAASAIEAPEKAPKKLTKLAPDDAAVEMIAGEGFFNSVTEAYQYLDGETPYYGFVCHPYGYANQMMEIYVMIDANGTIYEINADDWILQAEYFTAYELDKKEYRKGFEGLTVDSFTGEQALVSGATVTTDSVKQAVNDAFAAFHAIVNGGAA